MKKTTNWNMSFFSQLEDQDEVRRDRGRKDMRDSRGRTIDDSKLRKCMEDFELQKSLHNAGSTKNDDDKDLRVTKVQ